MHKVRLPKQQARVQDERRKIKFGARSGAIECGRDEGSKAPQLTGVAVEGARAPASGAAHRQQQRCCSVRACVSMCYKYVMVA